MSKFGLESYDSSGRDMFSTADLLAKVIAVEEATAPQRFESVEPYLDFYGDYDPTNCYCVTLSYKYYLSNYQGLQVYDSDTPVGYTIEKGKIRVTPIFSHGYRGFRDTMWWDVKFMVVKYR